MSMLEGAPWLLAHKSMLQVNQPMKVSLYGQDYVLWKDANGDVTALSNVCPHMGAMLSEGWCVEHGDSSSAVACPFHALEFDRQGCTVLPGSHKQTKPLAQPLALVIQNDFIWSYGGHEPKRPIPDILNQIAGDYEFFGSTTDTSVETSLLPMLLNMHDYNHQNGTHREMFRVKEVNFTRFIDNGHHSEAFFDAPTADPTWSEIRRNPAVLMLPKTIQAHLDNHFPSLVMFHGTTAFGQIKQCHIFVPEAENRTRTYVLVFGSWKSPLFRPLSQSIVNLVDVVVEQDANILGHIYDHATQQIKLNNEVGMDWVKRNFEAWAQIN